MASFANSVITYLDASRNFLWSSLTDTTLYPSFIKELLAIYNALRTDLEIDYGKFDKSNIPIFIFLKLSGF